MTGLISLQSKGRSRVFSNTTVQQHQFFSTQLSFQSNSHPYMTTGKTIALTRQTFVGKVMSLLFNMLSVLLSGFGWFLSSSNTVSWCFLSLTGDCCLAEMQNGMGKGPQALTETGQSSKLCSTSYKLWESVFISPSSRFLSIKLEIHNAYFCVYAYMKTRDFLSIIYLSSLYLSSIIPSIP